jgi:steroid delta-isomerase-like uncharacterized protein
MTNSENIVRQYFQAENSHDIDKVTQLLHPQYSYTGSDGQRREGVQAGIDVITMYLNAFPDMKIDVRNIYSIGDVTITEFTAQGTQKGKFLNINPTNKRVNVPGCDVIEVRDNKIYSEHEYSDTNTILQQLGVQTGQPAHA